MYSISRKLSTSFDFLQHKKLANFDFKLFCTSINTIDPDRGNKFKYISAEVCIILFYQGNFIRLFFLFNIDFRDTSGILS